MEESRFSRRLLVAALLPAGLDPEALHLRLAPDADSARPRRLLNADTARLVAAILEDAPPPRGVAPARLLADTSRFAAKTGTSFGFRDA